MKIGAFVREAMANLSESGFVFSDEEMSAMTTKAWGKEHFHSMSFLRLITDSNTDIKDDNGRPRFWKDKLTFGKYIVYVSNDWYETDREKFISWYNSLR